METLKIVETYHHDGDQTYYWSSIEEALESGRFDFLNDMWDDDNVSLTMDNEDYETFEEYINSCSDLRDFITRLGESIFYIDEQ
jgi:hypothetical protein